MPDLTEYLSHPNWRCFSSQNHDSKAMRKLVKKLRDGGTLRTIGELQPVVASFALARIPRVRGPMAKRFELAIAGSEDDEVLEGEDAVDIRSLMLMCDALPTLTTIAKYQQPYFEKIVPWLVDLWPAIWKWLQF